MTENRKQWAAWTITVLLTLAIALFFGVQYPLPERPEEDLEPIPLGAHFTNPIDIEGSSSASAPALTFEGDTDTGIFRSAANTLNIASGGSEMLEVDSSGFTISSATTLDVDGGATIDGGNLDVNDAIDQDGASDEVQLSVTGYTTQTNDLAQFSGGTTTFADKVHITESTGVALETDGTFQCDGTLDSNGTASMGSTGFIQNVYFSDTSVTVDSNGDQITHNSSFVSVNCTSAVTCTIADGDNTGEILILYNDGTQTATIDESEYNADTGGDITFTTDDALILLWTGSVWTNLTTLVSN